MDGKQMAIDVLGDLVDDLHSDAREVEDDPALAAAYRKAADEVSELRKLLQR